MQILLRCKTNLSFIERALNDFGAKDLIHIEEPHSQCHQIYAQWPKDLKLPEALTQHTDLAFYQLLPNQQVDWNQSWSTHAWNFRDGYTRIPIKDFMKNAVTHKNKELLLKPGPGFGDFSHPSTQMTLHLMVKHLQATNTLIDIGCGSGILSLFAALCGVTNCIGLDIDPLALQHATENSLLNQADHADFLLPEHFDSFWKKKKKPSPLLITMNMISSEQRTAWNSLPLLHSLPSTIIISGILISESSEYLKECQSRGWQKIEDCKQEGWIAFAFKSAT